MASLREIKERIASVGSTLKITTAMKMVSAAKLHKAQNAIGNLGPYQAGLAGMLLALTAGMRKPEGETPVREVPLMQPRAQVRRAALVCFASNSSLCGAFNANAIRLATQTVAEYREAGVELTVFSVGRKMADAMRRLGYPSPADYSHMSGKPSYEDAAALGRELTEGFLSGRFDRVEFVWNHHQSAASQPARRTVYLPLSSSVVPDSAEESFVRDYIIEPDRDTLIDALLPRVLDLKLYTTLLDACCAEHAARTVAMQMASDNAESLLQSLTLEYNKSRQQKITAEILDLVGGAMQ